MQATDSGSPKVFISYSHDSQEHLDRVLELANQLRDEGIDCQIDQYEMSPVEGWAQWTINQIEASDFVLVVCTEKYNLRFRGKEEAGKGNGAKWEGAIITQEIYEAESRNIKFIPILLSAEDEAHIPVALRGPTYYTLSAEGEYEKLYRYLTNQPRVVKPQLGKLRPLKQLKRKQDFSTQPATDVSPPASETGNSDSGGEERSASNTRGSSYPSNAERSRVRASWIFGSLLLLFFIYIFAFGPETLPDYKRQMLALTSALLAGLFGFFLTGDIGLKIKPIQSRLGTVGIKAAGGLALFVLVLIWWSSPFAPMSPEINHAGKYTVRLIALDPQQRPVEDADVQSSIGELKKASQGWELTIPESSVPPEKIATISARKDSSPPLIGKIELRLGSELDITRTIPLERDRTSRVYGSVVDVDEQPVPNAIVKVEGFNVNPQVTDKDGNFQFQPNWGRNEQVYLSVEKRDYEKVSQHPHLAGDEAAYVVLSKRR